MTVGGSDVGVLVDRASRRLRSGLAVPARWLARRVSGNAVSAARVLLVPAILWLAWIADRAAGALLLYTAGWGLDLLDGAVAEQRRRVGAADDPALGEFVDTVCDKLYLLPLLVALPIAAGAWPWWAVLVPVVVSELVLLARRCLDYRRGLTDYSSFPLGKVKVWQQAIGGGLLLATWSRPASVAAGVGLILLAATLPYNVLSLRAKRADAGAPG